eukprot:Seg2800.3 transcript_id=Seg2800.3/GoldUCD/mRNA.D3Y31 product="Ras-related protein Rab-36" protein_id=Seg2800.3/GoldUCD/D3Y31
MDGILKKFPEVLFKDASPRPNQINFHVRTRDACAESSINLKTSKCVVIGDLGVGKTSIINRYCRNVFEKDYKPTIGVEYEVRRYEILKTQFQLQIWDTSGEERFKSITAAYYRGSNAIMVTFDLTESLSLTHARSWLDEALNNTRTTVPEIFLVGNKKDSCKSRQLEEIRKEAKAVCEEMNAEYWEVSAKSGENVKDLFTRISAICFDQAVLRELEDQKVKTEKVKLGGGSANNGLQTIQLGKQNLEQAENAKSKRGCCKSS